MDILPSKKVKRREDKKHFLTNFTLEKKVTQKKKKKLKYKPKKYDKK